MYPQIHTANVITLFTHLQWYIALCTLTMRLRKIYYFNSTIIDEHWGGNVRATVESQFGGNIEQGTVTLF